jgi:hypothetical protein
MLAGCVTIGVLAAALAWASVRKAGGEAQPEFSRACGLLYRGLAGNGEALRAAGSAFRDALGGPFADRAPHLGIFVAAEALAAREGRQTHDPAVSALLRGDLRAAKDHWTNRGGAVAEHATRLLRGLREAASER